MRFSSRGLALGILVSCVLAASGAIAQGVPTPVGPPALTVQINGVGTTGATIVASGSTVVPNVSAASQLSLIVNAKSAPTGTTPTLTYTIAEVDPGDQSSTFAGAQTASGSSLNAAGTQVVTLVNQHSTAIKVSWVVTGTTPSFTNVFATLTAYGLSVVNTSAVVNSTTGPTSITAACTLGNINTSCVNGRVTVPYAGQNGVSVTHANSGLSGTLAPDCQLAGGRWVAGIFADPVTCAQTAVSITYTTDSTQTDRLMLCPQGSVLAGLRAPTETAGSTSVSFAATTTNPAGCSFYDSSGTAGTNVKLLASTAIAGKFTTDQTTPGTSDLVHAAEVPATSGGLTTKSALSAASTNSTSVKTSAGQLYGWYIINLTATPKFVKLYDSASAPTCGSGTPSQRLPIPANSTTGAGTNINYSAGITFASGIGYCITGAVGDADTTATVANDVVINLFYK